MKSSLEEKGRVVKRHIISMSYRSKTAEIGSALSISDILTILYFNILNVNPKKPFDTNRDRFILSKGHGSAALYATLAVRGYFPESELEKYRVDNGRFHGHPCRDAAPGIEVSTGSLGHGLSIGAGTALALKKDSPRSRVFVLIGDGECNEGSIWEAAMFVSTHKLTNIVAIVDDNGFQGFGETKKIHNMGLNRKFKSFGWNVKKVDGHNHVALIKALDVKGGEKPTAIIAKTVAGKGMKNIENTLLAHYYIPDQKSYEDAMKKLS